MIPGDKIPNETFGFWSVMLIAVLLISNTGKQIISWILMRLYDLFIVNKDHISPST
jgi:hypothetical protein